MPATLWVPLRRSRSCPPPTISASTAAPSRTASTPTPFGPPNLWALSDSRSTCGHSWRRSSQLAACTASVCTRAPGACSRTSGRHGRQVGDGADLVVDGHHADDRDVVAERVGERVELARGRHASTAHHRAGEALDGVQHGVVLRGGAHRAPAVAADGADDRRVVGFRAAPREHDLARAAADRRGDVVAGLVDRPPRVAGEAVRSARVGEALGEERQHRVDRGLAHRRRRRVVEVDQPVGHAVEANGGSRGPRV